MSERYDPITARRLFLKYARKREHREKVERALRLIERAERPLVLYSGGKDSSVVVHLTSRVHKNYLIFHWDYGETLMPRKYELESLLMLAELTALSDPLIVIAKRPQAHRAREDHRVGYRAFWGAVDRVIKGFGVESVISSLRAEESHKRKSMTKEDVRKDVGGKLTYHPIKDWSWIDVFAYLASHRLPWHSHYDRRAPLEGWDSVRFVTFFDREFEHLGSTTVDGVTIPWFRWVLNRINDEKREEKDNFC